MNLSRPCLVLRRCPHTVHCRYASFGALLRRSSKKSPDEPPTPATPPKSLQEHRASKVEEAKKPKKTTFTPPAQGSLQSPSIFDQLSLNKGGAVGKTDRLDKRRGERNVDAMMATLDPVPSWRKRFERKMIIQTLRRRGRVGQTLQIKRTERAMLYKMEKFYTSMKKLSLLARQIAGKTLDDAMTQMEFSKKKYAKYIRIELENAKNKAITKRGMGLGALNGTKGNPTAIRLKDGSKHIVTDRTSMYIEQAYVLRGKYGTDFFPRARGRVDRLRLPTSNLYVILKEEATRVREHQERVAKEEKKLPWIPLPDRPITAQRQYYCW